MRFLGLSYVQIEIGGGPEIDEIICWFLLKFIVLAYYTDIATKYFVWTIYSVFL